MKPLLVGHAWGIAAAACVLPSPAWAHVKWFSAYNVAAPPEPLSRVFQEQFIWLLLLTSVVLFVVFIIDCLLDDYGWEKPIDAFLRSFSRYTPDILKVCLGAFLLCLWLRGGIILTPELKTNSEWISWFQLLLAMCTILWRTTFIAGAGVVVLYLIALHSYGLFHLMDYPLFLGIAAYLIVHSLRLTTIIPYSLSILYLTTAQTLFWASIEKWAYWDWTMPLLERHQHITLGINPKTYVMLAGFVEFSATFLLLTGRLSQRFSALVLLLIFVAAVVDFGKIDAVGHLMIIATLLVVIINGNTATNVIFHSKTNTYLMECGKLVSIFLLLLAVYFFQYYALHAVMFRA